MLTIYSFAMVLGGALLLISVIGGDSSDLDVDGDLDLDGGLDTDGGADAAAAKLLSFRSATYGLFGFGATGAVLTALGIGTPISLGTAAAAGIAAIVLVNTTFGYLKRTDSGARPGDETLVGLAGRVTLPMSARSAGTVVVERAARQVRLRALPHTSASGDPSGWTQVVVVDMDGDTALVVPLEDDRLLDS